MFDNNRDIINNNTTISSVSIINRDNPITYYFVPFYAILFLIGTFGNGLVLISIVRSSRLRTVTNTYLLNIAIADILLLLSIPFLIITILANGWIFGNVLCKMYYNFIHINQYVSSLLLAALSFDRYLAVCHPIRAIQFRTRTKCVVIIAGRIKNRNNLFINICF
jgi:somatostatin receptor 1